MNQAATAETMDSPPIIESAPHLPMIVDNRGEALEDTKRELAKRAANYTPLKNTTDLPVDRFKNRYVLHCSDQLPQYSYGNVKAYNVTDESDPSRPLYAAVSDPSRPYRYGACQSLRTFEHAHMIRIIDAGVINVSAAREYRFVVIYERPEGKLISQGLMTGQKFTEHSFTDNILRPAQQLLSAFEDMGISHARIQLDNCYFGDKLVLGDCITEPAAYSKHFLYEPVERLLSNTEGRGAETSKIDMYALAVLAIECMFGLEKLRQLTKEAYTNLILTNGAYNVLTAGMSFSDNFNDFLIGALQDQPKERWSSSQLGTWLSGKRFNLIKPSPPRDANRPYDFNGQQFFSGRALANNFFVNWETARNSLRDDSIARWLDQSGQKKDVAETLRKTIRSTGGYSSKSTKFNDELLSRVITTLDPEGPLRHNSLSFNIDVIGNVMCDAVKNNKNHNLNLISELLEFDLPNFWGDIQPTRTSDEVTEILWKIERSRVYIGMKNLGFGMERFMYEMNPQTPCLSPKVQPYHITTLEGLLYTLDGLAEKMIKGDESLVDRHISAFIGAHAAIVKEGFFRELQYYPGLMKNQEIQVILLLAKAQDKAKIRSLKGLCYWAAYRMAGMTEHIHGAQLRKTICRDILHVVDQGHIGQLLMTMVNSKLLTRDMQGFTGAIQTFRYNRRKIVELSSADTTRERATRIARNIASIVSLGIFFFSLYTVISEHMVK